VGCCYPLPYHPAAGRKRLAEEREEFERLVVAIQRLLNMA
jgi:hypothetical protein